MSTPIGRSRVGNEGPVTPSSETPSPEKRHLRIVNDELGDATAVGGAMSLAAEECSEDRRPSGALPGERLRAAREARGLTLEDLSRITKISRASLTAIEAGDATRLPADIYTRGFVKAYAREVGLDPERMAEGYLAEIEPVREPQALENGGTHAQPSHSSATGDDRGDSRPEPHADPLQRVGWLATGVAVTGLIVYLVSNGGHVAGRNASGLPPAGAVSDAVAANQVTPERGALTQDAVRTTGEPLRVDVRTQGLCWLVISIDGEPVLARLLQPGEHHTFDVGDEAVLRVGDPGALTMSINGQTARPLGAAGEAVDVRITQANFHQFLRS